MDACHGSVILCAEKGRWLVWGQVRLPITRYNVPRLRSDLPVKDGASIAVMGLPAGQWLIRVAEPRRVAAHLILGQAPDVVMAQVKAVLRRECDARRIEASSQTVYSERATRF